MSDLSEALIEHIHLSLKLAPTGEWPLRWAMSREWHREILSLTDSNGRAIFSAVNGWAANPMWLFGYPIEIREDAGPPHLESRPR